MEAAGGKRKRYVFTDLDGVLFNDPDATWIARTPPGKHWSDLPGVFLHLTLLPNAREGLEWLLANFENVFLLSTPAWGNISSFSDKRASIEMKLGTGLYGKLILAHAKDVVGSGEEEAILIDDRTAHGVDKWETKAGRKHLHFGKAENALDWQVVCATIAVMEGLPIPDLSAMQLDSIIRSESLIHYLRAQEYVPPPNVMGGNSGFLAGPGPYAEARRVAALSEPYWAKAKDGSWYIEPPTSHRDRDGNTVYTQPDGFQYTQMGHGSKTTHGPPLTQEEMRTGAAATGMKIDASSVRSAVALQPMPTFVPATLELNNPPANPTPEQKAGLEEMSERQRKSLADMGRLMDVFGVAMRVEEETGMRPSDDVILEAFHSGR